MNDLLINNKDEAEEFWRNTMKAYPGRLPLPADMKRWESRDGIMEVFDFELPIDKMFQKKSGSEKKVPIFDLVLSIFNILLSKLTNREDIIIEVQRVTLQKDVDEHNLDRSLGMPMRNFPHGNVHYADFLAQLILRTEEYCSNSDFVFEELFNDPNTKLDFPLRQFSNVFYDFYDLTNDQNELYDLKALVFIDENKVRGYDLGLTARTLDKRMKFSFSYNTKIFWKKTIERYADYFKRTVEVVLKNEKVKISEIKIFGEEEEHKLLFEFNNTRYAYPKEHSIIDLFRARVKKEKEGIALHSQGTLLSYSDLDKQSNKLACYLRLKEASSMAKIAIIIERSIEFVVAVLAVLKNGSTYVPMDTSNPAKRLNFILKDSSAKFLLTTSGILNDMQLEWEGTTILIDQEKKEIDAFPDTDPIVDIPVNDELYILYTSGSTGMPKGVIGSQTSLLNRLYWGWSLYPYIQSEVCCQYMNLGFVDHVSELFAPLLKGVPIVIFNETDTVEIEAIAELILHYKVSRITIIPSLLWALLIVKKNRNIQFNTLRYIFCSGEVLPNYLAKFFYKEFGSTRLVNIYGSTEIGGDATYLNVDRYNVEEVLKYFKDASQKKYFKEERHERCGKNGEFTASNVSLDQIAEKFTNSEISVYPWSLDEYYALLHESVIPYSINTASPSFIGHMTSVLPDYVHTISKIISELNQNLVKIETSKSATFLEREAIAILHRVFYELPASFYDENIQKLNANFGIITSGGSLANISALLSARNKSLSKLRERKLAPNGESIYATLRHAGYNDMVILGTELMHYSFKKAISVLGLGMKNIKFIAHDSKGRMLIEALENTIAQCKRDRVLVISIVGIAGSTERGNIDALNEIAAVAKQNQIHFHVDAAWGGALIFSDTYKHLLRGIENADSITFCGHKQLFLPQGISVCLFKDPYQLIFNSVTANYQAAADSFDMGRFTLEGSRPGVSMNLHASLRVIGKKGYELLINSNIEKAMAFALLVGNVSGFELISRQINIVNYRYIPPKFRAALKNNDLSLEMNGTISAINQEIQEYQFYQGRTFISKTTIKHSDYGEITVFRAVLSNPLTTQDDLIGVLKDQFDIINFLFAERNDFYDKKALIRSKEIVRENQNTLIKKFGQISIGKPINNTRIYILDPYHNIQPIGVSGEICVSGDSLSKGYLGRKDLMSKFFIKNPFEKASVLYKTGDLGKWNIDGTIEFMGRIGNQVKVNGMRIELEEIENVLLQKNYVEQAVVLVGEQYGDLLAFVSLSGSHEKLKSLKDYTKSQLPYYMLPLHFIIVSKIPLTPSGKLNKNKLLDKAKAYKPQDVCD